MIEKYIKISFSGDFGRAFSIDATNPDDLKNKPVNLTLSPKAAQMLFADLEKALKHKQ